MEKKEYTVPKVRSANVFSRYGLLQNNSMSISNENVEDDSDIGFSKDANFDNEGVDNGSNVWED